MFDSYFCVHSLLWVSSFPSPPPNILQFPFGHAETLLDFIEGAGAAILKVHGTDPGVFEKGCIVQLCRPLAKLLMYPCQRILLLCTQSILASFLFYKGQDSQSNLLPAAINKVAEKLTQPVYCQSSVFDLMKKA